MGQVIYLDRPETWHPKLVTFARRLADELTEAGIESESAYDLDRFDLDDAIPTQFRAAFEFETIACYHSTRLLPHEVAGIQSDGLHVLSDDLRNRKLHDAQRHHPDVLSDEDIALLMENGPLNWQVGSVRNGSLCFVTPWTAVIGEQDGLSHLFTRWGGEAIGWTSDEVPRCEEVLSQLDERSTPAVVEFTLSPDLFADYQSPWFVPVGIVLGLAKPWTESRTYRSVPADQVLRVRTPMDIDWPDELDGTPRHR